jgi:hypothetical protein
VGTPGHLQVIRLGDLFITERIPTTHTLSQSQIKSKSHTHTSSELEMTSLTITSAVKLPSGAPALVFVTTNIPLNSRTFFRQSHTTPRPWRVQEQRCLYFHSRRVDTRIPVRADQPYCYFDIVFTRSPATLILLRHTTTKQKLVEQFAIVVSSEKIYSSVSPLLVTKTCNLCTAY